MAPSRTSLAIERMLFLLSREVRHRARIDDPDVERADVDGAQVADDARQGLADERAGIEIEGAGAHDVDDVLAGARGRVAGAGRIELPLLERRVVAVERAHDGVVDLD